MGYTIVRSLSKIGLVKWAVFRSFSHRAVNFQGFKAIQIVLDVFVVGNLDMLLVL